MTPVRTCSSKPGKAAHRHTLQMLLTLPAWACLQALAAGPSPAAQIIHVTLYPDSALIERAAKVSAGVEVVELPCLPGQLDERSLRVTPTEGVRIGTVSVQEMDASSAQACRQTELDTRIRALEDKLDQLQAESQAQDLAAAFLKSVSEHAGSSPDGKGNMALPTANALSGATQALAGQSREVFATQARLARQKEDVTKELEPLRQQRDTLNAQRGQDRLVRISVAAAQGGDLRVSYLVGQAGWTPAYRANLQSASRQVLLERQAIVAQRTGEDWRHVPLKLSTGRPQLAPSGPEPSSWPVSVRPPVRARLMEADAVGMAPAAPMMMAKAAAPMPQAEEPLFPVQEIEQGFTTEFVAPRPVDLRSDGQKITLSLGQQQLPVALTVRATPRLSRDTYVVAQAASPSGVWPAGPISLLRDGTAVGQGHWAGHQAEHLTLAFGKDDLVQLKAEPAETMNSSSGVLTSRSERKVRLNYRIVNQHRQPIKLEVIEATPVSTDEQISAQSSFNTPPTDKAWQDKPGVMRWLTELGAQQSWHLQITHELSWPKAISVIGLP